MTVAIGSIVLAVLFMAYSNGANDNFKGVATLYGSATASYTRALGWATATTYAGSMFAVWLAGDLVKAFSGKGLVPDALVATSGFKIVVFLAAATTVILATRFGFPVSTTHALTGSLVGAGWMAVGSEVNLRVLGKSFALPLLASPVLSLVLTTVVYVALRTLRQRLGIERHDVLAPELEKVVSRYTGKLAGIDAQAVLDVLHYLAAGLVSFARGYQDTPKIAGLMLGLTAVNISAGGFAVGLAMAIGGLLHAHRVARTMSSDITDMNPGQGFTANAVTGALVLLASPLGLPVSTTHVSCGSLFAIGMVTGQARWRVIASILTAWVTTLPVAAVLAMGYYLLVGKL